MNFFLFFAGLVTGLIDSIAGGGGLISLPSLGLALGLGPHAIGTNKIVGTVAALVAWIVYARRGHFQFGKSLLFSCAIGVGAWLGSRCSPLVPQSWFKIFLMVSCPVLLWVVWRKDLWIENATESRHAAWVASSLVVLSGLGVGFYDGIWGPGGGTFMFLALLFFVKMPLLPALAASKFANTVSAGTSLASYAQQGFVHPTEGLIMAASVTIGAYVGATLASQQASRLVRPVLAVVAVLLAIKLAFTP